MIAGSDFRSKEIGCQSWRKKNLVYIIIRTDEKEIIRENLKATTM